MSVSFFPIRGDQPPRFQRAELREFDINVCNANAADILDALGLPNDPCGEIAIEPFMGLCRSWLRAHIGQRDAALPASRDKELGKCEIVFFGRREGYLNEKIHALSVMAIQAKEQGATHIVWG